ncbi:hypothetical protein [Mycolicibacterium porcinum]|nr:hypothetical protein [Mycolicibacterium porcinum]
MAAPTLNALALVCSLKRRPGPVADATAAAARNAAHLARLLKVG